MGKLPPNFGGYLISIGTIVAMLGYIDVKGKLTLLFHLSLLMHHWHWLLNRDGGKLLLFHNYLLLTPARGPLYKIQHGNYMH